MVSAASMGSNPWFDLDFGPRGDCYQPVTVTTQGLCNAGLDYLRAVITVGGSSLCQLKGTPICQLCVDVVLLLQDSQSLLP
jgi:hypothetical protein